MKVILEVQIDTDANASEGIILALEPVGEGRGTHYRVLNLDDEIDAGAYERALAILHASEQDAPVKYPEVPSSFVLRPRTASMRVDEDDD